MVRCAFIYDVLIPIGGLERPPSTPREEGSCLFVVPYLPGIPTIFGDSLILDPTFSVVIDPHL